MLDRLMYLKVSCSGGCQVTMALEIALATAREDAVSHHTSIRTPLAPRLYLPNSEPTSSLP